MPTTLVSSPQGQLRTSDDAEGAPLDEAVAARIIEAFARGTGEGILQLATTELSSTLPPALSWARDLGCLLVGRACASSDVLAGPSPIAVEGSELEAFVASTPPIVGAEYVTRDALERAWGATDGALRAAIALHGGLEQYLAKTGSGWHVVGRVCFHLAENKRDEARPFAFLATYARRMSKDARVQHVPLGEALREYAGARDRPKLLALLLPVQRAAEQSALVRAMVDAGDVYQPLAWTAKEAHALLAELPLLEASGIVVRVPNWWSRKAPPRPKVTVTIGKAPAGDALGMRAMLDFDVGVTLDGERLSREEIEVLLASSDGLALVKGRWVEIDRARLGDVLAHWKTAERAVKRDGVSFAEAMRMIAGANVADDERAGVEGLESAADVAWSKVVAGEWLEGVLARLRDPSRVDAIAPGEHLAAKLRPYQEVGVRWLWLLSSLGLGACLADDMGLGKTIQVIALLLLLSASDAGRRPPHLLVVPASLISNWTSELERFAPSLRVLVAHPSATSMSSVEAEGAFDGSDVVVTTYGTLVRSPAMTKTKWRLAVLDEAQAIKNPSAKQTRAVKGLDAESRIALTGTPVENRLSDLWSLFDFLNPGLLGSAKEFARLVKKLEARTHDAYVPLRELVRPYILRRLKSDKRVIDDLPDKTELRAFCPLTKPQAALYQQGVEELAARLAALEGIERRGVVLSYLLRFKQICNHPSQWLGDGAYRSGDSGKLGRLRELCEPIASRQEKLLVFTQFREMTAPLATFLEEVFGRAGLVLHGEIAVGKRKALVESFQRDDGPPFFVLSLKAGGTGLNLTAASHVVHFDRWWNPAVENQATDRAYRIGQKKNVLVHKFVCRGTIEERIDALVESKRALMGSILEGGAETLLTELPDEELLRLVSLDARRALSEDS